MKKIVGFLFLVVFGMMLAACTEMALTTPDVTLTDDTISWEAVEGATQYYVYIDNTATTDPETDYYTAAGTSFDLTTVGLVDGTYSVYVVAVSGTTSFSANSTAVTYVVGDVSGVTLSAPVVTLTEDVLSWPAVTDATGYVVMVDGNEFSVSTTSYDLTNAGLTPGEYQVTVKAVATGVSSAPSTAVTYTIETTVNMNAIIAGVLPIMDEDYSVGLTETDFEDDWAFEDYEMAVRMVTAYAEASYDVGLMDNDAIDFFQAIIDLSEAEGNMDSMEAFLASTDIFESNNITPEVASHLVMTLLSEFLTVQLDDMGDIIPSLQSDLADDQTELATLLADADYVALLAAIANNVPVTALDTAALIAAGGDQSIQLILKLMQVANDRQNELNYPNHYYYVWNIENETVDDIIAIVIEIENGDDAAILETLYLVQDTVYNILNKYDTIRYIMEDIDRMTMIIDRLDDLEVLLTSDAVVMENAVEMVFGFILTIRETFPAQVVTLLDDAMSGESMLTTTEIVLIKNELVSVISDALPDEEDFQMFYQALLLIGEVALGNSINDLEDHADYLGSVQYHSTNVGLLFLGSVSIADVNEVMTIVDTIQTTYVEEGLSPLDNPTPLLDAAEFLQTYIEAFKADNETAVTDLEALLNADAFEPIYQEILTQLIGFATEQDPEELDMILYILESLSDAYDEIINVMAISPNIVNGLLTAFMDSDASILSVISSMQDMENPTMADIISALESLIDEAALYHDVLAEQFTRENIESILSLVVIPAMVETDMYMDETFEPAIRALIPDIAQVILNAAALEADLFTEVQALVIGDYINETNGFAEPIDLGSALAFIHLLDAVLTTENETLIDDTIDLVFTDILGDATLQSVLPIDPLDLPNERANIESMLDDLFTAIHEFALLDMTTLTLEQETSIMQFAGQLGLFINTEPNREDAMMDATPLTLDTPETVLYRTDPLFYSFTPTSSGYYELVLTLPDMYEGRYELFNGMHDYLGDDWFDGESTMNVMAWFDADETYYLMLDLWDAYYIDVNVSVTSFEPSVLTQDVLEEVNDPDWHMYYEFTPAADGHYTFTFDTDASIQYRVIMRDGNGSLIMDDWFDLYLYTKTYYVIAELGVPIYIELLADEFGMLYAFDILVEVFDAADISVGVPQEVTDDTTTQNFVFMVDHSGYYDLMIESDEIMSFDLIYAGNYELQHSNYTIMADAYIASTNLLRPGELYRIEISNMTIDGVMSFTISETPADSLVVASSEDVLLTAYDTYYYTLQIDTAGLYHMTLSSETSLSYQQLLVNEEGMPLTDGEGSLSSGQTLGKDVYLVPGMYYGKFFVDTDATVTISFVEIGIEEVFADQEIYIDLFDDVHELMVVFIPDVSGEYRIYSYDNEDSDPLVKLSDGMDYYQEDDDNGEGSNFDLYDYFEAGNTYLIYFSSYDEQDAVYTAMIELTDNNYN